MERREFINEGRCEKGGDLLTAHPIIMSAESVRAILAGRKTQTRRVIRPQPTKMGVVLHDGYAIGTAHKGDGFAMWRWPCAAPDDLLWVREAHWLQDGDHDPWPDLPSIAVRPIGAEPQRCYYREGFDRAAPRWRSPLYMPRWASRITLRVTEVRVQRVQEISEADAVAEGYADPPNPPWLTPARDWYRSAWDQLNAKRGYPWDANPRVWALTFEVIP